MSFYKNLLLIFPFLCACKPSPAPAQKATENIFNASATVLESRIRTPKGYKRVSLDENSFGAYLRHLQVKPAGASVKYYDGRLKPAKGIYCAVIAMEISKRDLQQCADAVMRLRGEYLFWQKRYKDIRFNFLSDGRPRYFLDYAKGKPPTYAMFLKYMDYIFAYANTASLYHELNPVKSFEEMQPGDVLIRKGNPYGHAVIVLDMAVNEQTGEKLYLLGQSYMPAQETQVLINPTSKTLSPWYRIKAEDPIQTPEWTFYRKDLRRFE